MSKHLLLIHASENPRKLLNEAKKLNQPVKWIFLCQDYTKFLAWEKELAISSKPIRLAGHLQETASRLRKPFLDLISDLGEKYDSPAWWSSRISERNTLSSFLFLYCCYLQIVLEQLSKVEGSLCVVSESQALLSSIKYHNLARENFQSVKWINGKYQFKEKMAISIKPVFYILRLIYKSIVGKIISRNLLPKNKSIIIHTYVDESCFGEKGFFHDRYFPGLKEWLEDKGHPVIIMPVLYNIKRSYIKAWQWFSKSQNLFINPYSYYKISDYIFAIRESLRQMSLPSGKTELAGMDITRLVNQENKSKAFTSLEALLYHCLPKRLNKSGLQIDRIIDVFENLINEKLLITGLRKFMPGIKIIGFQHSTFYPLLLCLFVTKKESLFAPIPDRVICNGEFFKEILIREGLPSNIPVAGPALRYKYLWELNDKGYKNKDIDIFVPLPHVLSEGVELLTKLIEAFNDEPLRIVVKPHPMSVLDDVLNNIGKDKVPANFEFVQGNIDEWIPRARTIIGISSGSIYEGLAAGVPVIVVGRESALNLNPLDYFPDLNKVVYSPEEIKKASMEALANSKAFLNIYKQTGRKLMEYSFNPSTDENMAAFIEELAD